MRVLLQLAIVCLSVGVGESACPHLEAGLENWGDTTSWTSGVLPVEDDQVVIPSGKKLLLNVSPPCLSSITIEAGAALVWGDVDNLNVCVSYILIRGRLQIGSEDCRFTRKTHIRLTGESNSTLSVSGFGRKFIGVAAGGTIEVHGEEKPSWTKLIQTAKPSACDSLFDFQKSVFQAESAQGLYVSVFNEDSSLWDFAVFRTGEDIADEDLKFQEFVESIPQDKILAVALQGELGIGVMAAVYETLETAGGLTSSAIRNVTGRQAYAFITRTGNIGTTVEKYVPNPLDKDFVETGYLAVDYSGFQFRVNSKVFSNPKMKRGVNFKVLTHEAAYPCLKLNADVSRWSAGDKIVIASTDFDWRQAEEMTIKSCPSCAVNEICLTEPLKYMHYGEVTLGVDERAEVGLLSRNILIEGVIPEDGCSVNEPEDQYFCDLFGFDTFGGHIKVVRGFTAAHIQGVELYHMGQQRFVGTYPLHFHMCDDVDGNWFRHNSIHHSLTRCVTVHGSDGAEVSHNVCYLHRGHGFFLEDSAEQRNVFDSNLCIGTMHGTHIMSDMKKEWCNSTMKEFCNALSSYWITHPNNTFINNVAAGSDNVGFWILASKFPLGPSRQRQAERGLVPKLHAMQTKVKEFRNNTAHSNAQRSLRIDHRISHGEKKDGVFVPENGVFGATISHTPRDPPTATKGSLDKSYLYGFTAYKNNGLNVWTKAGIVIMSNFTLADATRGITMAAGTFETYAEITNSLFVGETDNLGLPQEPFGRSRSGAADEPLQGVLFYQGPGHVTNTFFDKYETITSDQITRYAGSISVKRSNPYPPKASSHVEGIKFGFCDVTEGNWAFKGDPSVPTLKNRDGNRQITFRDIDGSVSGMAGTQFVPNTRFHTTNQCDYRPVSNFAVCPHDYAKAVFKGDGALKTLKENYPMYMRRDDRPDDPFALKGTKGNIYLVIKKKSYTVYFNGTAPTKLTISAENLESGDYVRLGLCYPKDVTSFSFSSGLPRIGSATPAISVSSISDLDRDTTGRAYFWDKSTGLLFIKIYSSVDRVDGEKCPGYRCPSLTITRTGGSDDLIDCYNDAYDGTYNIAEDDAVNIPTAKPCTKTTSEGFGAEVEANFFSATASTPVCPSDPVHQGRSTPELKGCYMDSFNFRDVPHDFIKLTMSMTVSSCVERCYYRGYVYAALQNGNECRCGNMYGGFGNSTMCSKSCSGDNTVNCGGSLANAVYTTGNAALSAMVKCRTTGAVIDGKCYYLTSGTYSYVEAQAQCVKLGGNLATINSQSVQSEVERYMRPFKTDAWFGLNDVATDGTYVFIDGTTLGSYNNVMPGQGMSTKQDYGVIRAKSLYGWDDSGTGGSHRALCQLPLSGSPPSPVSCGHNNYGQQLNGGDCYLVINTAQNYNSAKHTCYTRRGTLADVSNAQTWATVKEHIYRFGQSMDYWVEQEEGEFIGLEDTRLFSKKVVKTGNLLGVVCKIETLSAAKPCSTGWVHNGGSCYLYTGVRATYAAARGFCNQGDSQVLTVLSDAENTFVGDTVKTETLNPLVYIGYVYNNAADAYEWEDGSSSAYTNWNRNHGVDNVVNGECARLLSQNYKWKNTKCNSRNSVMCKAPTGP
ncbi:cell surface hyaluronidase-like [Haliotis rufescens]|uniref:cell surface hyaluronidase-like n=1 Tax=Haliotis rufescens TaxID=6454 RepID=UPI001EB089D8|nr:cell surface hyaluronidase-like [Haliotis rufescens]